MTDINEFYHELLQDVHRDADADGRFVADSFFRIFTNHVVDAGELETADRAFYESVGMRVDGYGGDPSDSEGILTLIVCDFHDRREIETLTRTDMDAAFKRATKFLSRSLDGTFRISLEETSAGFGLAEMIAATWPSIRKVRMLLLSNRSLSARVEGRDAGEFDGRPLVFGVWDLQRLFRFVSSGKAREDLVVMMRDHGDSVHALPAHLANAGYEAYLVVMPGRQLASIYDRWGARLLEQNVRVFLQARGGVNKGIKNTLDNEPEMFFAYNNGITATAESVETRHSSNGLVITSIKNLQIVNGGQTTASIYAAMDRSSSSLDKVFVQMKLSIIPPDRTEVVVPKISEYANSQNKVNAADFFANHPFHIRFKDLSERTFAPSRDGSFRETKWFYERARGQYLDARTRLTDAGRRKFDLEYPKSQLLNKEDLAKVILAWDKRPDMVSKGRQKNFAAFAAQVGKEWEQQPDLFNESYFQDAVAKAIVLRETEALVSNQPWYDGGYRAQVVAYTIAKLSHDVAIAGRCVDFGAIWKTQAVSTPIRQALIAAAAAVNDVLVNPPPGRKNVTEWAKQPACWSRVRDEVRIHWPKDWWQGLLTKEEASDRQRSAIRDQRVVNGIEAQTSVFNSGAIKWQSVRDWGISRKLLSQKEIDILSIAAAIPLKIPSEKQCILVLQTFRKLQQEGCPISLDA